ncbi:MAG TPA: TlyA family RNA methyltransferase [Limnobacter sp.]|nr:TlyA family RNA methyltransferase [Limnobacter sp.]
MRADIALVERGLCTSRAQAQQCIEKGRVQYRPSALAGWISVKKPSQTIEAHQGLELTASDEREFVSRGGLKLLGALQDLGVNPAGLKCMDVGQSTGGFTDCLLQEGAACVVGLDVGHGQLHPALRMHKQVHAIEGVNVYKTEPTELLKRLQQDCPDFLPLQLVVADLSFIALRKVLPHLMALMPNTCSAILLVKPQFELGPEHIGKNGLVKNLEMLLPLLEKQMAEACVALGLEVKRFLPCRIRGGDGNQEFFLHLEKHPSNLQDSS